MTAQPSGKSARYTGEVVYLYAFDLAYDMRREPIPQLLGQKTTPFCIDASRRNPRHHSFYQPPMVRLPSVERIGPRGLVKVERVVKLLPIGAASITVRVPFAVDSLEELICYHDLKFPQGSLSDEVRQLAEDVLRELQPHFIRPVARLNDDEAYTVFCLEAPATSASGATLSSEQWLAENRRQIAALLTQEPDLNDLSAQEAEESTGLHLSYYRNDVVVIDWDAALLLDEKADFDETLYVMELANLQLAELEAYDRLLDDSLERAYRDLGRSSLRRKSDVLRELKEIRIDMARFSDELSNITKFFGDWHLARIYKNISARFHLPDWHHTIDEKLKTLDGLYEILKHDQNNRLMLVLEVTIVLLFIVDLVILLLGLKGK